jgi:hypothetical protein
LKGRNSKTDNYIMGGPGEGGLSVIIWSNHGFPIES